MYSNKRKAVFDALRCTVAICLATALSACAATEIVERTVVVPDCDIPDLRTRGSYAVEVWGIPNSRFNVGEALNLQLRVSAPSHVTMFHVSTSCKVTRLLDNEQLPMAKIVDFPARGSGMAITVKPPGGREGFYVIATRNRLSFLSAGDILREQGGIAALDMAPAQFYQRLEQARARSNPAEWSLTTLRTDVVEN